jgi:hypothetical protein
MPFPAQEGFLSLLVCGQFNRICTASSSPVSCYFCIISLNTTRAIDTTLANKGEK